MSQRVVIITYFSSSSRLLSSFEIPVSSRESAEPFLSPISLSLLAFCAAMYLRVCVLRCYGRCQMGRRRAATVKVTFKAQFFDALQIWYKPRTEAVDVAGRRSGASPALSFNSSQPPLTTVDHNRILPIYLISLSKQFLTKLATNLPTTHLSLLLI
ncbi:uncharacterized protein LOC143917822 [Arctopsyche grandis]|uniref:uncharacterized protein LOC143917822 n=1 Tax=Arctopsyche grandis TaxID=121162 RepID=UPI00406D9723